jgi:chromosome segregation ATPase
MKRVPASKGKSMWLVRGSFAIKNRARMKYVLQNLLICFALALCGLVAVQWIRETGLRQQLKSLDNATRTQRETVQNLESKIRGNEAEIVRLDSLKNELNAMVKSNRLEVSRLTSELEKATVENGRSLAQLQAHQQALQTANENLTRQNEEISKQNARINALIQERNDLVIKFNSLTTNYSALVERWNKQQADLARAATNTAPRN